MSHAWVIGQAQNLPKHGVARRLGGKSVAPVGVAEIVLAKMPADRVVLVPLRSFIEDFLCVPKT